MTTITLTDMEKTFLLATQKTEFTHGVPGEDMPWVFAAITASGIPAAQARGVMSSLVQKGILSIENSGGKGRADDQYVFLSDEGKALYHELAKAASDTQAQAPEAPAAAPVLEPVNYDVRTGDVLSLPDMEGRAFLVTDTYPGKARMTDGNDTFALTYKELCQRKAVYVFKRPTVAGSRPASFTGEHL